MGLQRKIAMRLSVNPHVRRRPPFISHSLGNRVLGIGRNENETTMLMSVLLYLYTKHVRDTALHSVVVETKRHSAHYVVSFILILSSS